MLRSCGKGGALGDARELSRPWISCREAMGEAYDVPPQCHSAVSPSFEGGAGRIADQAHRHAPVEEAFDEDAWFEQEAARLRQLNESKAQEVRM